MRLPRKLTIVLYRSEEGYSVSVPELPGCHSQGDTEEEALRNIQDAIRDYLAVAGEVARGSLDDPDEVRSERYRKMAMLLEQWRTDRKAD